MREEQEQADFSLHGAALLRRAGRVPVAIDVAAPEQQSAAASHPGTRKTAETAPRFSVIIPAYQAARTLPACLAGLESQTLPPDEFEVLVVDNNSTDSTLALARQNRRARVLQQREQGAYAARNLALAQARGQTLVFTDPDCVPDPNWLRRVDAVLREPGVLIAIGPADAIGRSPGLKLLSQYERHKDAYVLHSQLPELYYGHTNNMAVRREVFEALGPFPRRQRGGDTIMVRRAVEHFGCDCVRYDPRMRVWHLEVDSVKTYFRKVRTYGASSRRYGRVVAQRPLSMGERLRTFLETQREEHLSLINGAHLLFLLTLGLAYWRLGALAAGSGKQPEPLQQQESFRKKHRPRRI